MKERVEALWKDMHGQNWDGLAAHFCPDAEILWPNTNERFTVPGFVRANSEYPGDWAIAVEKVEACEGGAVSVVQVSLAGQEASFHAVSFFTFAGGKIARLEEYWGDDGPPPAWRQELGLSTPIQ